MPEVDGVRAQRAAAPDPEVRCFVVVGEIAVPGHLEVRMVPHRAENVRDPILALTRLAVRQGPQPVTESLYRLPHRLFRVIGRNAPHQMYRTIRRHGLPFRAEKSA
jgi:hypothetical protein